VTLMKRHVEKIRAAIVPVLERSRGADTESRVRALVELVAAEHAVEPKLHAIFTALGPQLGFEAGADADADAAIAAEREAWIRAMAGMLPDPALSLWVAQTAIHAVFHAAFIERPDVASSAELVDELVRLVTPYLAPRRRASRKR